MGRGIGKEIREREIEKEVCNREEGGREREREKEKRRVAVERGTCGREIDRFAQFLLLLLGFQFLPLYRNVGPSPLPFCPGVTRSGSVKLSLSFSGFFHSYQREREREREGWSMVWAAFPLFKVPLFFPTTFLIHGDDFLFLGPT